MPPPAPALYAMQRPIPKAAVVPPLVLPAGPHRHVGNRFAMGVPSGIAWDGNLPADYNTVPSSASSSGSRYQHAISDEIAELQSQLFGTLGEEPRSFDKLLQWISDLESQNESLVRHNADCLESARNTQQWEHDVRNLQLHASDIERRQAQQGTREREWRVALEKTLHSNFLVPMEELHENVLEQIQDCKEWSAIIEDEVKSKSLQLDRERALYLECQASRQKQLAEELAEERAKLNEEFGRRAAQLLDDTESWSAYVCDDLDSQQRITVEAQRHRLQIERAFARNLEAAAMCTADRAKDVELELRAHNAEALQAVAYHEAQGLAKQEAAALHAHQLAQAESVEAASESRQTAEPSSNERCFRPQDCSKAVDMPCFQSARKHQACSPILEARDGDERDLTPGWQSAFAQDFFLTLQRLEKRLDHSQEAVKKLALREGRHPTGGWYNVHFS